MWHAVGLFLLVGFGPPRAAAQLYSERGGVAWPPAAAVARGDGGETFALAADGDSLAQIVDELRALRNAERYEADGAYDNVEQDANELPMQYEGLEGGELANTGRDIQAMRREGADEQEAPAAAAEVAAAPAAAEMQPRPKAQKKGQFEFVEFVEPHAAAALKNVEHLKKRAPIAEVAGAPTSSRTYVVGSNNVFFIVAVTVCSVASVVGVVGGAHYINTMRKQRADAFDDFTRYSPAGPGRDVVRKGRGFAGSPIQDVHGDDALAKAAHLHHFTQTKQKIIGEDNGVHDDHSDRSDDEADDIDEANFSIYECPGLAPTTGDIEVQNPNFAAQQP